ncbi:MAG: zinc ribbon domain-containing protein [Desulfobacterales bacterium]|nr:zinc ribbon domain-containing protein [Desulfobacterales bacterium]
MPIYEYCHINTPCSIGKEFEIKQSITDSALNHCPICGGEVRKLISYTYINTPKSNTDIRNLGFTKLVKRDDGVYENVTARGNESRYMIRDKPETMPHLNKIITD